MVRAMFIRPLVLAFLLSFSGAAFAQGGPPAPGQTGIFLGVRGGYGIPGGKVGSTGPDAEAASLSDGIKGMVPFALEIGYRVMPNLSLGATLQYGFDLINTDNTNGCGSCSSHDISFGANLYLHPAPGGAVDPWLGLGVGYESLAISGSADQADSPTFSGVSFDESLTGLQFLNLQAGLDFAASPVVSLGPFIGLNLGKYDSINATLTQGGQARTMSIDIKNSAVHEWVTIGLRCRFNL
jgi:hypothetical protein